MITNRYFNMRFLYLVVSRQLSVTLCSVRNKYMQNVPFYGEHGTDVSRASLLEQT